MQKTIEEIKKAVGDFFAEQDIEDLMDFGSSDDAAYGAAGDISEVYSEVLIALGYDIDTAYADYNGGDGHYYVRINFQGLNEPITTAVVAWDDADSVVGTIESILGEYEELLEKQNQGPSVFEEYAENIDYYGAPGIPANKIVIFENGYVHTEADPKARDPKIIEDYINKVAIPWAFMNGIYCVGMDHGSFVRNREYVKSTDVPKKKEDDYSVNVDILNYVFAVMAAAVEHANGKKGITVIEYCGEADFTTVNEYADEKAFLEDVQEFLDEIKEEK